MNTRGATRSPFLLQYGGKQQRHMGLSKESIIECLRESYGESVTSAEIKAFCQMNDFNYQTITNKLTDYKVGRGKWNLEVTKETVE